MSTPSAPPGLAKIGQIAVNVRDLDRAVGFYRDTLGMHHLFSIPTAAFFQCGDVRLMLGIPETPELDHPASIIYYQVNDIQRTSTALAAVGVPLEAEPHLVARMPDHDLWMCFLRDSEGNLLGLMSEVRKE